MNNPVGLNQRRKLLVEDGDHRSQWQVDPSRLRAKNLVDLVGHRLIQLHWGVRVVSHEPEIVVCPAKEDSPMPCFTWWLIRSHVLPLRNIPAGVQWWPNCTLGFAD